MPVSVSCLQRHIDTTLTFVPGITAWHDYMKEMAVYQPPQVTQRIGNPDRKWEVVSALQKMVRRGETQIALRLVGALSTMPSEWPYFMRRLTVIAAEEVGPANRSLVQFVIACSAAYTPSKAGYQIYDLYCYLVKKLCEEPYRSRVWCSMEVIRTILSKPVVVNLTEWDKEHRKDVYTSHCQLEKENGPHAEWVKRHAWRTDGLLKFVMLGDPEELVPYTTPIPAFKEIAGLPSCAYDMYTRTGRQMLKLLAKELITKVLENVTGNKTDAIGEALFFTEGGRIKNELISSRLYTLEQKCMAAQFGLEIEDWYSLKGQVEDALKQGRIDELRSKVVASAYK